MSQDATFLKVGNWFKTTDEKQFEAELEDYLVLINRFSNSEVAENK